MAMSHTQDFSNEVLTQNFVANFFHLSNQPESKKENSVLIEKNGLTMCV